MKDVTIYLERESSQFRRVLLVMCLCTVLQTTLMETYISVCNLQFTNSSLCDFCQQYIVNNLVPFKNRKKMYIQELS